MTVLNSIFSDDSDESFTEDFLANIPEDSDEEDSSEFNENPSINDMSTSTLILEMVWHFLPGSPRLNILNIGPTNKVFLFEKEGLKSYKMNLENKH